MWCPQGGTDHGHEYLRVKEFEPCVGITQLSGQLHRAGDWSLFFDVPLSSHLCLLTALWPPSQLPPSRAQ